MKFKEKESFLFLFHFYMRKAKKVIHFLLFFHVDDEELKHYINRFLLFLKLLNFNSL